MPAIYLPVMAVPKRREGWWNSSSAFKYPYCFASYPTHKNIKNLRQYFNIDSDVVLYSDSGGYEILSSGMVIDPYELSEWYNSSGIDVGIHLDYPPYLDVTKKHIHEFDERLELTVKSSKILLDRVKSSIKLYATIHGLNYKQMDIWRSTMELVSDDWFGWAISVAPVNDPIAILRCINYLELFKNDKPIHFFKTGDMICFLLIARYANMKGLLVTADSTAAFSSARKGRSYMTILGRPILVGLEQEESIKNAPICLCPVCRKYGIDIRNDVDVFEFHNTYMLVWRYMFLNSISTESYDVIKQIIPEAVGYVQRLDSILKKKGSGLLGYV